MLSSPGITDGATGVPTLMDDDETAVDGRDNLSDDMSDTGWDTDLEIEGVCVRPDLLLTLLIMMGAV